MTDIGSTVLEFYRTLPFNMPQDLESLAAIVRENNVVEQGYPILVPHLKSGATVLEVGCGTGWLSNAIQLHYGCAVLGLDFNRVATERASEAAAALGLTARFTTGDLFEYTPPAPFDVVVSNGVLHHTDDAMGALDRLLNHFVAPGGVALIGLYHLHGRRPFLEHFETMRLSGATEEAMIQRYAELHPELANDRTHLLSWYRDQVCHPHETQHTLAEIMPHLESAGFDLVSTSINRFGPLDDLEAVLAMEPELEQVGRQRLAQNLYFPGFFLFLARKRPTI